MGEEEREGEGAEGDVREVVEGRAEDVAFSGDALLGAHLVVVVLGAGLGEHQDPHQDVERLQVVAPCKIYCG